jgi:hypothetical protein
MHTLRSYPSPIFVRGLMRKSHKRGVNLSDLEVTGKFEPF